MTLTPSTCSVTAIDSDERFDFPSEETKILNYWDSFNAFQRSNELAKQANRPNFTFYDGPPFATGLPHYGHILAGTIKDTVLRYAYQKGYQVERRFGWDCHGLPVEYEIDKKLGITTKDDVLKMGIAAYNEECRSIVTRYTKEWEVTTKRFGRWIDFANDYKTMYPSFMESVWWVFQQLYNSGYVYKGYKVMAYSCACTTPLSNFEANLNYKDVDDPSVYVTFPLVSQPEVNVICWTTTPWTLPSNLGLCVHPDFEYVKIKDLASEKILILAECRLSALYKDPNAPNQYEFLGKMKGADLVGMEYEPIFDVFSHRKNNPKLKCFRIVSDTYVTSDAGTGIVHTSPAYGEDDQRIGLVCGLILPDEIIPQTLDDNGKFTSDVIPNIKGTYFLDANREIIRAIKIKNRLFKEQNFKHSYPHCWRSDTRLIYRAVPSWFVRVSGLNDRLLATNAQSNWVPEHVRDKRFSNWLASARDWAISRNRYWGTPIPIWISEDGEEIVCIGSMEELKQRSGVTELTDLHRHYIDNITIPSSRPGHPPLRRIEEVFDCWFESGSVPYACQHYPFENKSNFDHSFPADFIGEGVDQTRGWFYTLVVISTLLLDKPPFKNVIVNGLILASDGKKMSKRLKNYPEPSLIFDRYGADALRLYLINSPVVCAESLRFKEEGVKSILKDVFLPWVNSVKFFTEQAVLLEQETGRSFTQSTLSSNNIMDKWILSSLHSLISYVRQEMDAYRLYTVLPKLLGFIENLTNWYIRMNRKRLKGHSEDDNDRMNALQTLFNVLFGLARVMSPFVPFLSENMYLKLKQYKSSESQDDRSVHFLLYPTVDNLLLNPNVERSVSLLQGVIEQGRSMREAQGTSLKTPLRHMYVLTSSMSDVADLESLTPYIKDELNVQEVELRTFQEKDKFDIVFKVTPNFALLGKKVKGDLVSVQQALSNLSKNDLEIFADSQSSDATIKVCGHLLTKEDVNIERHVINVPDGYVARSVKIQLDTNHLLFVLLDIRLDPLLIEEGLAREVANRVQKLRKKANLKPMDQVQVYYRIEKDTTKLLSNVFTKPTSYLRVLKQEFLIESGSNINNTCILEREQIELNDGQVNFILTLVK